LVVGSPNKQGKRNRPTAQTRWATETKSALSRRSLAETDGRLEVPDDIYAPWNGKEERPDNAESALERHLRGVSESRSRNWAARSSSAANGR